MSGLPPPTLPPSASDATRASGEGAVGVGHQRDFVRRPQAIISHPATGAPIAGQSVPSLDGARAMGVAAHGLFPDILCIGWDIAYTYRGHVLLEANVPPGMQPSQQIVLGNRARRRFVELFGFHARQLLEATEPPGSRFLVGRYGHIESGSGDFVNRLLFLLRHKLRRFRFGGYFFAQQGHRSRLRASAIVRRLRTVAIEFGTCLSGRSGGAAGLTTFGNVRRRAFGCGRS
jgi:hypothetical protein